jgi:tRNA-specific 2-thiouridylase
VSFPLAIPAALRTALAGRPSVLLALSGGVDSGLSLALLRELGCEVGCVTFKNFCYGETGPDDGRSCCSQEAIDDARRLAARFGAGFQVTGVEDGFRRSVIEPFVADYRAGHTPNPCVACNARVRFPHLLRLAELGGYELVATGHYARVVPGPAGSGGDAPRLLRAVDEDKDQSYFLYRLSPATLRRLVFPLGWSTKEAVRRAAAELELPVAGKRESQEICFVPDGDRSFLFGDGPATAPGEIVDARGKVLGRHRGLVHYTVGQRRGLEIAAPDPLYVLALEPATNRLVVGRREELARTRIDCDEAVIHAPGFVDDGGAEGAPVVARIRHRHRGVAVASWRRRDDALVVELAEPAAGVAPGQALVLYAGERVIAGGRIVTAGETSGARTVASRISDGMEEERLET